MFFQAQRQNTLVPLPKINEEKKAILETYTKEHSAEYQVASIDRFS